MCFATQAPFLTSCPSPCHKPLAGLSQTTLLLYNNVLALPLMAAFMLLATNEAAGVLSYPQVKAGRSKAGLQRGRASCKSKQAQGIHGKGVAQLMPSWVSVCSRSCHFETALP